ncbi:hypothetical protein EZJ43_02580 [Pedobacter changchengzhani]|uniref:DUF3078 domain-containing protein n=1 Tax=Pedobacter changchengzhani TaxID=2529274 RepID=A0A4R5MR21_9SPHI|nr:hypothetical protein [Pedobacter changchengzhani]TDG37995.1 hypothetical protein EZJ43_02580 [Pedobacter changchengzhani]
MKLNIYLPIICLLFFCSKFVSAQTDSTETDISSKKTPYFKASLNFLTNNVYQGRTDSVKVPYLTASFAYYLKNGLNINVSESFQTNTSKFDNFAVDLGYDHDLSDEWALTVDLNKSFYNKNSTSIRSAVLADLDAEIIYDPGFLTFNLSAGLAFASKTDYTTALSVSHWFALDKAEHLSIVPQFMVNAGTQNFYTDYRKKTGKRKLIAITNYTVANNTGFAILDYEIDAPITWANKSWSFFLDPVFAIPVHPITTTTTSTVSYLDKTKNTTKTNTENLKGVFYASVGIDFKFK